MRESALARFDTMIRCGVYAITIDRLGVMQVRCIVSPRRVLIGHSIITDIAAALVILVALAKAPTLAAAQPPQQIPAGWRPSDGPVRDVRDSPYVPSGYQRKVSAEFNDSNEVFDATHNPLFITENRRL